MDLNTACFFIFTFLFIGYLVLEGFDYGVGMLLPFLGRTDTQRQALIKTLAPVWEGNEVWLIAAGAFLFAGFPNAYATLFSGMYLALLLILASLIFRGAAFEFRDKEDSKRWRNVWDWSIFFGGLIPALLWGVALANLIKGLPIDAQSQYVGTFGDLVSLYTLTGGAIFTLLFLIHGVAYLTLKVDTSFLSKLITTGVQICRITIGVLLFFCILTVINTDIRTKPVASVPLFFSLLTTYLVLLNLYYRRFIKCFVFSTISIVSISLSVFWSLFPRIIVSSLDNRFSLTVYNSASNPLTLKIMSLTMLVVLPLILGFEVWKYNIFRQRILLADIQLEACENQLTETLRQLKTHIKHAHYLADKMSSIINALRSNNGNATGRLEPGRRVFFKKLPRKFFHDNDE